MSIIIIALNVLFFVYVRNYAVLYTNKSNTLIIILLYLFLFINNNYLRELIESD